MQGKGKCPLPLQPIPKTNNKTKINNKTKVVYTEDWTHPRGGWSRVAPARDKNQYREENYGRRSHENRKPGQVVHEQNSPMTYTPFAAFEFRSSSSSHLTESI